MNSLDFNSYNLEVSKFFDGFIDPQGNYYKVKEKGKNDCTHDLWAKKFITRIKKSFNLELNVNHSAFLDILSIDNFTDLLVNGFGFAYYNHDSIYLKPIIKLPNPDIANRKVTNEQIESLIKIMLINDEDPYHKEFLIDANMFYYNGLEEGGCIKK